jgi:hypothetical protein
LGEKRRDEVTPVLLADVPEVEIEITHRGLTGIAHDLDIFDDCRTCKSRTTSVIFDRKSKGSTNHRMLLPEPATYNIPSVDVE